MTIDDIIANKITKFAGHLTVSTFLLSEEEFIIEQFVRDTSPEHPDARRVGGGSICGVCGREYYDHPAHFPHTYLTVLCDGRVVKL